VLRGREASFHCANEYLITERKSHTIENKNLLSFPISFHANEGIPENTKRI